MSSDNDEQVTQNLTSGGLILYDAVSFYELLCQSESDLSTLQSVYRDKGTWNRTFHEGFEEAYAINYDNIFLHAIKVLDHLPSGADIESALEDIYDASQFVVSRAGLLQQDLSGRIYHSALGKTLAKNFATYYTKIPPSDLLAWLAVRDWDDKVADFACGSGTLLNSAYSRKLSLALPDAIDEDNGIGNLDDIHQKFLEDDIYGLDAMTFAAHLTVVNLAMQRPIKFDSSNIYHVPVTNQEFGTNKVGSLDLLGSNTIEVQKRMDGGSFGAGQQSMEIESELSNVTIPQDFDVVIMNPPFTEKSRATQILDMSRVNELAREHDEDMTGQTGLAAPFVLLGDLYLKKGGRLALVLPSAVIDRYSWDPVREMLAERYDIEHIMLTWAPGEPAWSEDTDRREILLIARKLADEDEKRQPTIVSHTDKEIDFAEARDISQLLRRTDPVNISIRTPNAQVLSSGVRQLGGAKSYPPAFLTEHTDNWYRFGSFRNPDMVRLMLSLEGIMSPEEAPYGVDIGDVTDRFKDSGADVKLFLKNIKRAGYRVVDDKPDGEADWTVNTSSINKIWLEEDDVQWVFRDYSIKDTPDKFDYKTGDMMIPGFSKDFYHSVNIIAFVPREPSTGSVWFPVDVPNMTSTDGEEITSREGAKVMTAWLNSTPGIVPVLGYRAEVRGARSDYKTNQLRRISVLNPSKLNRDQVDSLLDAYDEVKDTEWSLLRKQLEEAVDDEDHPRRKLDEQVFAALMDDQPEIETLEQDLLDELNKLGRIMNG